MDDFEVDEVVQRALDRLTMPHSRSAPDPARTMIRARSYGCLVRVTRRSARA